MTTILIRVKFFDQAFEERFETEKDTPEYKLADEAYRVALLFAETQIYATYGHMVSAHEFGRLLEHLDYEYKKVN